MFYTPKELGGLGMRLYGFELGNQPRPPSSQELAALWQPYVQTCIELFGADRCMFESNFPVDKGSCSYGVLWNAYKRMSSGASAAYGSRPALARPMTSKNTAKIGSAAGVASICQA